MRMSQTLEVKVVIKPLLCKSLSSVMVWNAVLIYYLLFWNNIVIIGYLL